MSDTKKLIEALNKTIRDGENSGMDYITASFSIDALRMMRRLIQPNDETLKQQPQPGDLVEKILNVGESLGVRLGNPEIGAIYKKERAEAKAEIRKLLPAKVSITREEIDSLFKFSDTIQKDQLRYWLKSKGIPIKEKP